MDEETKEFKEGFNNAYLMMERQPDMAELVSQSMVSNSLNSDYVMGFHCGHDMYIIDNHFEKNKDDNSHKQIQMDFGEKSYEKLYQIGFNAGYYLTEHKSELLDKVAPTLKADGPYSAGIISGRREYELEKIRAERTEQNKNISTKDDKDIERDDR